MGPPGLPRLLRYAYIHVCRTVGWHSLARSRPEIKIKATRVPPQSESEKAKQKERPVMLRAYRKHTQSRHNSSQHLSTQQDLGCGIFPTGFPILNPLSHSTSTLLYRTSKTWCRSASILENCMSTGFSSRVINTCPSGLCRCRCVHECRFWFCRASPDLACLTSSQIMRLLQGVKISFLTSPPAGEETEAQGGQMTRAASHQQWQHWNQNLASCLQGECSAPPSLPCLLAHTRLCMVTDKWMNAQMTMNYYAP